MIVECPDQRRERDPLELLLERLDPEDRLDPLERLDPEELLDRLERLDPEETLEPDPLEEELREEDRETRLRVAGCRERELLDRLRFEEVTELLLRLDCEERDTEEVPDVLRALPLL